MSVIFKTALASVLLLASSVSVVNAAGAGIDTSGAEGATVAVGVAAGAGVAAGVGTDDADGVAVGLGVLDGVVGFGAWGLAGEGRLAFTCDASSCGRCFTPPPGRMPVLLALGSVTTRSDGSFAPWATSGALFEDVTASDTRDDASADVLPALQALMP